MTDRTRHLTVVLDRDMRVDDVEHVVNAIKMVKYVDDVLVGEPPDYMARITAKQELVQKFRDFYGKLLEDHY